MNRLVILDRDGVVNQDSDAYVKSLDEWHPIPGSIEAIARLTQAGFLVAVATNQSGIARGYFTEQTLHEMNNRMLDLVTAAGGRINAIAYCPHGPEDNCSCRKPAPGLIFQIEKMLDHKAQGAYFVGDSLRDLEAARDAGCHPVLVTSGKGQKTLAKLPETEFADIPVFADLAAFTEDLLRNS
ncbi:D-glycero-beta-D-manno-heptose-1,7-bisphosphate 7-phosphatase [Hahella sp. CCB-MM4]|uniref:D-glycero-beta-D-manno-heptose 1,7-bisphosphate 7-phosphatase n=1 Tax=Hahella sp. (strain CCB-MM4) TaxID=1926491 RepID=UPI000B9BE3A9|nr:D-glycero-beta-D-manno-heptose 1,7-bisphosphate 7-phosphatase [Hahella sp. CCB-MM4]OZG73248.1 D-glycero-beta-D-manno-heptose-1,7-bisphosphate 7-phosphatase [Hahella sp. CCB-MM4]